MTATDDLEFAAQLLQRGKIQEAIEKARAFVLANPKEEQGHELLAMCLTRAGKFSEAQAEFESLLKLNPKSYDSMVWLGEIAKNQGRLDDAMAILNSAIELDPERAEALGVAGSCELRSGRPAEATTLLLQAVELEPGFAHFHYSLGLAYGHLQKNQEAAHHLGEAIRLDPRNPHNYLALAGHYNRYGLLGKSLDVLSEGLAALPEDALLHSAAGAAFTMIRNDVAAEAHHKKAAQLSRQGESTYALWLVDQGRYEDAVRLYEAILQQQPDLGIAYYGIFQCRKYKDDDASMKSKMETLSQKEGAHPVSRMYLHYALGKIEEQEKNFESAMGHFKNANFLAYNQQFSKKEFDIKAIAEDHARLQQTYESICKREVWGSSPAAPIFIIGMIRSGTTLLDQIVSSHPLVANAGELRYWIEKSHWLANLQEPATEKTLSDLGAEYLEYVRLLVGDFDRFTDKMPLYFSTCGLIHRAFPNARFLHIRRHPVDTCLSMYTTYFGAGSQFVYNKANTVAYYKEYLKTMEYWRRMIPADRLMELDYETLISDRENVIKDVIEFCDLPWDDACLHHERNTSAINTPSRWQARQPIYKTSMERWRNYEPWLEEFAELLPVSSKP